MRLLGRGLILAFVPLILAAVIAASLFALLLQTDQQSLQQSQARAAADQATRFMLLMLDGGLALERVLNGGSASDRKLFRDSIRAMRQEQNKLLSSDHTADTASLLNRMNEIVSAALSGLRSLTSLLKSNISIHDALDSAMHIPELEADFAKQSYALASTVQALVDKSLHRLESSPKQEESIFHLEIAVISAGAALSILLGLALWRWFMIGIVMRVNLMVDNTVRLAEGHKLNEPLGGRDEIASLDSSFHSMAEALQKALAKERDLFLCASDIICILDQKQRFTTINPASESILGYKENELKGSRFFELLHPDDRQASENIFGTLSATRQSASWESRLRRSDGRYRDLLWSVYYSESDRLYYATGHDISRRQEIERQKELFLSIVSHDLRSPLSSIQAAFQLLTESAGSSLPAEAKSRVSGILENIQGLLKLLNDLLDLEKLQAGKMQMQYEEAELRYLIQNAIDEVEPLAAEKQIEFEFECPDIEFLLDFERMMQAFVIIMSSLIESCPGGQTLKLLVSLNDAELSVLIKSHSQQSQTEANSALRADSQNLVTKQAFESRRQTEGISLPICNLIIEKHGGKLSKESDSAGTFFHFVIPALRTAEPAPGEVLDTASQAGKPFSAATETTPAEALQEITRKPAPAILSGRLTLLQKGLLISGIPVFFELACVGSLLPLLTESFQTKQQELHQRLVATTAEDLLLHFYKMGTVMNVGKDLATWNTFVETYKESQLARKKLTELTRPDPKATALWRDLDTRLLAACKFAEDAERFIEKKGFSPENMESALQNRKPLQSVAALTPKMKQLIQHANASAQRSPRGGGSLRARQGVLLLGGFVASIFISLASAFVFFVDVRRRLQIMEQNTHHLQRHEALVDPLTGTDEISRLDECFHKMAVSLRAAYQRERAIFDNSQDVICALNRDGIIQRLNPACRSVWESDPQQLMGKSIAEIIAIQDRDKSLAALQELSAETAINLENVLVLPNGKQRNISWSLSWSAGENYWIAIAHDITSKKQLELLQQEFLSMISRDMREPLKAIKKDSEQILAGEFGQLSASAKERITAIIRSCDRLLALIDELLDLDQLESGSIDLSASTFLAADLLKTAAEELSALAQQKGVELRVLQDEPLSLGGDRSRLVQVCVNLISNAIKFSPASSTIKMYASKQGETLRFCIEDQGRGIPASDIDKVFDRFYQVKQSDAAGRSGTGLGLAICQQIVQQHGGTIGVESELGKGSVFWFSLPCPN